MADPIYPFTCQKYIGGITIKTPEGFKSSQDFEKVIFNTFQSLNTDQGAYSLISAGQPNSNNFSSTLLMKNGVSSAEINQIKSNWTNNTKVGSYQTAWAPGLGESLPSSNGSSFLDEFGSIVDFFRH